jgi:polyhydroxyalkanoate synthesis regulator phasin
MNSDTFAQLLRKGFRVTLGATATLIESLQDPQRREANFSKFATEVNQLAEEWESKGATTEQEARNFVDTLWRQQNGSPDSQSTYSDPTSAQSSQSASPATADVQQDLQELTAQLAAIRAEIEKLRGQNNS